MKKSHKKWWVILACLLIAVMMVCVTKPAFAMDVGNSFSGGGGGSSSGGSFSSGGSYSSGGGSFDGLGLFLLLSHPSGIIGLIIIVALFLLIGKSKAKNSGTGTNIPYANQFSGNSGINEDAVITKIQNIDPDFSAENFKSYASEVYLSVQEAWEKREWQTVRPFESNNLFNVHNRQLQEYIDQQKTDHLDMQNVRDVLLAEFRVDGSREILTVKLDASLLDYVTDDNTGKVLEGSKTVFQHRSYCLEFIRAAGVKTNAKKDMTVTNCPNCGAPTQVTSSGMCEYCKSVITTGDFGWVLNKYAKW